jgi:hypothetical protein
MLYISDSIEGSWELHPSSPIEEGKNSSRCGGSLFEHKEELYRPFQVVNKNYGDGLGINRVIELSTNNFTEVKFKGVMPNNNYFYALGGHHFNVCLFKNRQIIATDALSNKINFWEILRRIKNRI